MSEHKNDPIRTGEQDRGENASTQVEAVSPPSVQAVREPDANYNVTSPETVINREPIRYLVKDNGERVGVVLSWKDYQELCPRDPELLVGLSDAELEILAESMLTLHLQERLNHLLHLNREDNSSAKEQQELDPLLERVDQMNVLKARAMYTLQQRRETSTA